MRRWQKQFDQQGSPFIESIPEVSMKQLSHTWPRSFEESKRILAEELSREGEQRRTPFIQSCEHGKLSGQRCRECNRNVPYGTPPCATSSGER